MTQPENEAQQSINHQILAGLCLGHAMRALGSNSADECGAAAVFELMQLCPAVTKDQATHYVLMVLVEISKIPFTAGQINVELEKSGLQIPVH